MTGTVTTHEALTMSCHCVYHLLYLISRDPYSNVLISSFTDEKNEA